MSCGRAAAHGYYDHIRVNIDIDYIVFIIELDVVYDDFACADNGFKECIQPHQVTCYRDSVFALRIIAENLDNSWVYSMA